MIVERIQVEEGFLSGLDLELSPGLNVLIGPRGSGKTSVIELIRFCLNVKAHTEEAEAKARDHAAFVLGPGEVTVTLSDGEQGIGVSRTLDEEEPRVSEPFDTPIILSQNEIESVGLFPSSRLRLIDDFIRGRRESEGRVQYLIAQIQSQTAEIRDLSKEIESLEERLRERPAVDAQLADVTTKEKSLAKTSAQTRDLQLKLQAHSQQLTTGSLASAVLSRSSVSLNQWKQRLDQIISSQPAIENWSDSTGAPDPLAGIRNSYQQVTGLLSQASMQLAQILDQIEKISLGSRANRTELEGRARELRKEIEQLQQGAGAIARQASETREKIAHLKATETLQNARRATLRKLQTSRATLLDELEQLRQKRFDARESVALKLNKMLGSRIKIQVHRSAQYGDYVSALSNCLRGSGLKYNELSELIAENLSPRELVEAAEEGRFQDLSQTTGISDERASRVLAHVRENGAEAVLTCDVEDDARLFLLDGKDYKPTDKLSTGQRCTVIIPILLCHSDQVVIIDQPEDHLDNAFVVDTVVRAITARSTGSQLLFATHNANIPVLGNAARIIVLACDGERAFVSHNGTLSDKDSVQAITTVMEGGREAFELRAAFYANADLE